MNLWQINVSAFEFNLMFNKQKVATPGTAAGRTT